MNRRPTPDHSRFHPQTPPNVAGNPPPRQPWHSQPQQPQPQSVSPVHTAAPPPHHAAEYYTPPQPHYPAVAPQHQYSAPAPMMAVPQSMMEILFQQHLELKRENKELERSKQRLEQQNRQLVQKSFRHERGRSMPLVPSPSYGASYGSHGHGRYSTDSRHAVTDGGINKNALLVTLMLIWLAFAVIVIVALIIR